MLAFMAANVISIAPFLGFLSALLMFVGILLTFFVVQIGFGAVLLTRGGRRKDSWSRFHPGGWERSMGIDIDDVTEPAPADASANDHPEGSEPHHA
jgi:hypothetical protein